MKPCLLTLLLLTTTHAWATGPKGGTVPVVVAAMDIPAGTLVTMDMISQRSIAAARATSSVVKPDSASYIVQQRILLPVLAGDLLLWSFFEVKKGSPSGCAALYKAGDDARKDVARAKKRLTKR